LICTPFGLVTPTSASRPLPAYISTLSCTWVIHYCNNSNFTAPIASSESNGRILLPWHQTHIWTAYPSQWCNIRLHWHNKVHCSIGGRSRTWCIIPQLQRRKSDSPHLLEELGHRQPATPVHCDNQTATGIANNTVKKQRSRAMDMRYFWITDQVAMGFFDVQWHPGIENLADYFTKHFDSKHHQAVRPWYLYMPNSPRILPRAAKPSTLRGCVGTLPNGYTKSGPLPKVVPIRPLDTGQDRALCCTGMAGQSLHVAIFPIYPLTRY
jgi:hypothetical protein